ncbi:MAG TPA: sugar phosphate nucleotidyltransferase [Chthonomonadales bacterium]|nr:sugar phosphate nucleotidyltransferase [Chthonomonadales bacterium]
MDVETPNIKRAIVPAAGLGTRLRPLTHAIPKEMLPLGRKPVLEYVVEEMRVAGMTRLLFVVSPDKEEMIRRYFGDGAAWGVRCDYVLQPEMKGLGDAILRGETWTEGEPVLVAFGDTVIESSDTLPTARLVETYRAWRADAVVLTERVSREKTSRYGILSPAVNLPDITTEPFPLKGVIEKPAPEAAPSLMAVSARWVLGPPVFCTLRETLPSPNGEVALTDAVQTLLSRGGVGWAVPLLPGEARWDIGGWETYLVAATRAAMHDAEFGPRIRAAVCEGMKS